MAVQFYLIPFCVFVRVGREFRLELLNRILRYSFGEEGVLTVFYVPIVFVKFDSVLLVFVV